VEARRTAALVIAIGGAVLLLSFFFLPWEKFTLEGVSGETAAENKGPELGSVYNDDGETGGIFVGVTIGLSIIIFLLGLAALVPALAERRGLVIAAGLIALVWLIYSVIWLQDSDMVDGQTGIGATIGWIAAVAVIGAAIAAVVASRRGPASTAP